MTNFERILPSESIDEAEILRGILTVQAQFAAEQQRPLGRGTHTKGICARATFEVFDLAQTIGEPAVATRLAHGIFARPGVYNATVRFANAASTIYPDKNPDLRALSFSVELPPDLAPGVSYQDFSLQSAPKFPINDAHTFAVLMKVLSAGSNSKQLKVILSLPFGDFCRFAKGAFLGAMQQHGKIRAYQQMRYWSTVPFSNGPDEAAMFSAIPNPENPARALDGGPNQLRDELIRHLNEDAFMSSFDFGVQLLDPDRMTHWGVHKDPGFWIENATVEWKETQAPFHRVGRLTLLPKSELQREECEPRFIDVTEHATPDTRPLGSVNRARYAVELASRKVRLGEATAESFLAGLPQAPPIRHPVLNGLVKMSAILVLLALLLSHFVARHIYAHMAAKNIPAVQRVDQVVYLNQGWSWADRQTFYYTPQGTSMHGVRYSWFVHLERPFVRTRLADPEHMRSLNFIVDPPTNANPDQLPVGFAKRYDDKLHDSVVDITCAACHTGQLHFTQNGRTTAIRIDGGEAMTAFTDIKAGSFQEELVFSILETVFNPFKFERFANNVAGPWSLNLPRNLKDRLSLWFKLAGVSGGLLKVAFGSSASKLYPVQEGYGRTDALARIANVVFGDHISRHNFHTGNAPVSYPYLWNIWKFDWEQYNASVSQPMARNVGEAMGVGATMKFHKFFGSVPEPERYDTTISFNNLYHIETTLQKLTPPRWPEDILGKINEKSASNGQQLFQAYCVKCHGPHVATDAQKAATSPGRTDSDPMWVIESKPVNYIGTDPTAANNFFQNTVDLAPAGITLDEAKALLKAEYDKKIARDAGQISALKQKIADCKSPGCDAAALGMMNYDLQWAQDDQATEQSNEQQLNSIDMHKVNGGLALSILDGKIRQQYYAAHNISAAQQKIFNGFDTLDTPQVAAAYKPRPLEGVWATPPFLHNGSVPNLYELLSPVSEREKRFFVGRLDFEPIVVGYATQPVNGSSDGFWMDTSIPGNENTGHEFSATYQAGGKSPAGVIGPELTHDQRMDLIEYLKCHRDEPDPKATAPAGCPAE